MGFATKTRLAKPCFGFDTVAAAITENPTLT